MYSFEKFNGICFAEKMPAKRSARLGKRAAKAVTAPPRKKTRRPKVSPSTQSSESAPEALQPTQELNLSPGFIDQLVSRVADEVTKRLSTPFNFHNSQICKKSSVNKRKRKCN